ncbi:putative mitochondrial GTPase 1 [Venustampulla echinocandica]|uniref:Putative mitochondrial GTPase 1 n=1 Tax=Venustampulla echinocandica TaxID=2656787 RepID=A0A370U188_9HELO|nr:putative mitochondrial GTPase 1 [Venustampulla echinocandica]RDL41513.1 putative mitochondrial GTPase 1 [Venustampulla echinocandica]
MAKFIPRAVFPAQLSLPRSYFLGHHASGLSKMKTMLSSIDLIIECRDYRVPLTSRNPLFEQSLAGLERLVVYTKRDLGSKDRPSDRSREEIIRRWHAPHHTLFTNHKSKRDVKSVLNFAKDYAAQSQSLLGTRILVVGMPNVGKSSLLNALRAEGVHRPKAAFTGAQPGITRKIASGVKIVDRDEERGTEGVYLVDTPGVFIPFVPDSESMMKLALVGSVKDTIITPVTLCDYLLFHINKQPQGQRFYDEYCGPTNDIVDLLDAVCKKTGRLGKGGIPDLDAAALWIIQRWRQGNVGTFLLDEVEEDSLAKKMNEEVAVSLSQAKKQRKQEHVARGKAKHTAA